MSAPPALLPMKSAPTRYLCTAYTHPDRWDALSDPKHPLNTAWPLFLDHDAVQFQFANQILQYKELRKFQLALMESHPDRGETMIALGRSIPFYWPELDKVEDTSTLSTLPHVLRSLPDRGWDSIVLRGMRQHCMREGLPLLSPPPASAVDQDSDSDSRTSYSTRKPNALSALSITVRADRRNCGFAEMLIEAMKQVARDQGLRVLLAPLRPTRKSDYPWLSMEQYICCTISDPPTSLMTRAACVPCSFSHGHYSGGPKQLPFDPWLRKHVRLGGSVAKIAPASMTVRGSFAEWQAWTGIDFDSFVRDGQRDEEATRSESDPDEAYCEVAIAGGLVPLQVFARDETCIYSEPNVWLYHEVTCRSS
ncbi:MAG: hypothetical protein Q9169_002744 [Polycauliona sp. 2 TL-2023]